MANSIEIEIVANFKDNATDQAKELNAELDKLEKRNIDITAKIDSMNANIDRWTSQSIIGSKPEQAVEKVKEFSEKILSGTTRMTLGVDDQVTPAVSTAQRKLQEFENAQKKWTLREISPSNYQPFYGYSLANETRTLHGSVPRTVDNIKNGELAGPAERIADELSEINHTAKSYVPKGGYTYDDAAVRAIEITPLEEEADRRLLEQDARTMGIKFSSKTSNDELSQKIADYEDKNYWSKQGSQSNREIVSAGEEQGEEITDGYLTSLGQGMKNVTSKVASRFMGARMLYKGINDAASDFSSAFEAEYGIDRNRSLARGATKGGLMAAGALIGTAIPGVGTVLGAGAGALISTIWGDDLADAFSGIHKSAEEIRAAHLDEVFGNISMSADSISSIVTALVSTNQSTQMAYNQQAMQTEFSMRESLSDSYYGVKQQGSEIEIRNNLGLKTDKSDRSAYKQSVEDYTDGLKKTLLQQMYDGFAANDDLYGYGNWDATALSEKYQSIYGELDQTTKDLFKYLNRAFSDGDFTTDEIEHVSGVLSGLKILSEGSSPSEADINKESLMYLAKNGLLSEDSYNQFSAELIKNQDESYMTQAQTRSRAIQQGQDPTTADINFWKGVNDDTEMYLQTAIDAFTGGGFANDYSKGMQYISKSGLMSLDNENSAYNSYLNTGIKMIDPSQINDASDLSLAIGGAKRQLTYARDEITQPFVEYKNEHLEESGAFEKMYNGILPQVKMAETQYAAALRAGQDPSQFLDEMTRGYMIGALGGDTTAMEKYAAIKMSGNENARELMAFAFGNDTDALTEAMMGGDWSKGFGNMMKLLMTKPEMFQSEDQTAENANQAASDAASAATKTVEDSVKTDNTAEKVKQQGADTADAVASTAQDIADAAANGGETIKDKTESMLDGMTDTIEQSNEKADEAAKGAAEGLGENILSAIGESLDNIDADMLGESGIGEKLMNSIAESLSADNMDFGELSIGQSILEGISSSFEGVEFGELDIGAKIMDAISASLEGVDFSGITEGITSQFQELSELQCDIELNAQDNITDMATAADTAVREIPETWETNLNAVDNASAIANSVAAAVNAIPTNVNINITASTSGLPAGFHFASGTPNAPEGMAWLNDDGTADPRELIEHNGQFMMYEGRDVLAPLSKGDRVFTSAQTKDILSGKGIPHFAEGVNNEVIATNREMIGSGSSGASVSIDGVNINITIEGNSNGNVVEEIRQRSGEIAEIVTAEIQRHLSASFANSSGGDD